MRLPHLSVVLLAACTTASEPGGDAGTLIPEQPACIPIAPIVPFVPGQVNRNATPYLGEAASLTVLLPKFFRCERLDAVARSVHTQLSSPENLPVAHEVGEPSSGERAYAVRVGFTPKTSGIYHLAARFEPGLGTAQLDIFPIIDRTKQQADPMLSIAAQPAGQCSRYWLTSRNGVLCAENGLAVLFRGGAVEYSLPAQEIAVVDDVVWLAHGTRLSRYVDPGSGRLTKSVEGTSPVPVVKLVVARNEATVVGQSAAHRLVMSADGGLESLGSWTYDAGDGSVVAASLSGTALIVGTRERVVCRGEPGVLQCVPVTQSIRASSHEGVWLSDDSQQLQLWTPTGQKVLPTPFVGLRMWFNHPRPVIGTDTGEVFGLSGGESPTFVEWTRDAGWAPVTVDATWAAFRNTATGDIEFVRY